MNLERKLRDLESLVDREEDPLEWPLEVELAGDLGEVVEEDEGFEEERNGVFSGLET